VDLYVDAHVSEQQTISIYSPEDGDSKFLRNVCTNVQVHMVLQPRWQKNDVLEAVFNLLKPKLV
jgi:hypothetical protein